MWHGAAVPVLDEDWTQHKVTVVPDASGKLTLTCYAVAPGAMHIVHWDDIRIEGAKLENGGFEKLDDEATPAGWGRIGLDRDFRIVREEDGKALARTWHQAGLRQTLTDVKAGREIRIRLEVRTPEAASDK